MLTGRGESLPFLSVYLPGYSLTGCFSAEPIATSPDKFTLSSRMAITILHCRIPQYFLPIAVLFSLLSHPVLLAANHYSNAQGANSLH